MSVFDVKMVIWLQIILVNGEYDMCDMCNDYYKICLIGNKLVYKLYQHYDSHIVICVPIYTILFSSVVAMPLIMTAGDFSNDRTK